MWERPNCCYIGPSTGAADLFLAGNYISSDCRHREGNHQGCFAAVFTQPLTFHWRKLKQEDTVQYVYCVCVFVCELSAFRGAHRKEIIKCLFVIMAVRAASWRSVLVVNIRQRDPSCVGAQDHP